MTKTMKLKHYVSSIDKFSFFHFFFSRKVLACFYVVFLYLYELKVLRDYIGIIHPFIIIWAFVVLLYDFIMQQGWVKAPFIKTAIIFFISAAISTLLTVSVGGITCVKTFILSVLAVFVFYPACFDPDRDSRTKNLLIVCSGLLIITFIASLSSSIMYLIAYSNVVTIRGKDYLFGIYAYSKSSVVVPGIYADTNHAAAYSVISVILSLILFSQCKKSLFATKRLNAACKLFVLLNIIVQIIYFPLANSRGGWLSLIVAIIVSVFLYLHSKSESSLFAIVKALGLSIAAAVLCAAVLLGVRSICFEIYSQSIEKSTADSHAVSGFHKDDDFFDGSGRIELWKDALVVYAHRPVFGTGAGNCGHYAYEILPENKLPLAKTLRGGKNIHNSYLDLLVDYGTVGAVLLLGFFVQCAVFVIKGIYGGVFTCKEDFMMVCGVTVIACSSFFLTCAFINCTAMYSSLLIFAGYLTSAVACSTLVKG